MNSNQPMRNNPSTNQPNRNPRNEYPFLDSRNSNLRENFEWPTNELDAAPPRVPNKKPPRAAGLGMSERDMLNNPAPGMQRPLIPEPHPAIESGRPSTTGPSNTNPRAGRPRRGQYNSIMTETGGEIETASGFRYTCPAVDAGTEGKT